MIICIDSPLKTSFLLGGEKSSGEEVGLYWEKWGKQPEVNLIEAKIYFVEQKATHSVAAEREIVYHIEWYIKSLTPYPISLHFLHSLERP